MEIPLIASITSPTTIKFDLSAGPFGMSRKTNNGKL